VFHRATDTSDPIISSVNWDRRIQRLKKMSLPLEVLDLLECLSNQDYNTVLEDERPFNVLNLEYLDNVELENEEQDFVCKENVFFITIYLFTNYVLLFMLCFISAR